MKVLVSVSSKHGGSDEIGQAIADRLRAAGLPVNMIPPRARPDVSGYDAFVIGSGIYMGRWLGDGRTFVTENAEVLRQHPVWLFSSGPITTKPDPRDLAEGEKLLEEVKGLEHRLFDGRLDKDTLGITERAIVRMVGSPWGDYRPWDDIRAWADSIAKELTAVPA